MKDWKEQLNYAQDPVPLDNDDHIHKMLEQGFDPNVRDEYDNTPLHLVVKESFHRFEIVKALVEAGADVNAEDDIGDTPLMKACYYAHTEDVIEYLQPKVQDFFRQNNHEGSALINACSELVKNTGSIKKILGYYNKDFTLEDLEDEDKRRKTTAVIDAGGNNALHLAYPEASPDIIRLLLDHNVPFDHRNHHGELPIEVVANPRYEENREILRGLMNNG